jgi:hypothetical protein
VCSSDLSFVFDFVPTVDEDALVSIMPNVKLTGDVLTIDPNEYFALESARQYSPTMYAETTQLALIASGVVPGPWEPTGKVRYFGRAGLPEQTSVKAEEGRLVQAFAPGWLVPRSVAAAFSMNKGNGISDDANPKAVAALEKELTAVEPKYYTMADALALAMLDRLIFVQRTMSIQGRFRMDIAPGTQLRIHTAGERFSGKEDTLYAMVNKVRLDVSSNGASTFLVLQYVKSENDMQTFSVAEHPLYSTIWTGGPLIQL